MDFVQTMKDWRRMCKAYTTDDESCCEGCPVVDFHEHGCEAIFEMEDGTDWQKYADTIEAWAAEHPVVYPTWSEWLYSVGVLMDKELPLPTVDDGSAKIICNNIATDRVNDPIPADIAQKLGIEPKEDV